MKIGKLNLKRSLDNDQSGWLMIETAVSIPIISMLLIAMCLIFWQGWRFYRSEIADWILQEEICQAMQNMSQQIPQADKDFGINVKSGKNYDEVEFKIATVINSSYGYEHSVSKKRFFSVKANPEGQFQLYSNDQNDPITGRNVIFGEVAVTKFRCKLKRADLLRIELAGISLRTHHEFALATEIFLPNMQHE